jgi:hypothetical protein
MMIPSGSIVYQINKHQTEKLQIAMLLYPISLPGHFEVMQFVFFFLPLFAVLSFFFLSFQKLSLPLFIILVFTLVINIF